MLLTPSTEVCSQSAHSRLWKRFGPCSSVWFVKRPSFGNPLGQRWRPDIGFGHVMEEEKFGNNGVKIMEALFRLMISHTHTARRLGYGLRVSVGHTALLVRLKILFCAFRFLPSSQAQRLAF